LIPHELQPFATSRQASTAFLAEKKHQVIFPATTEQNIALVNFFLKPSNSSILMAIDVINAIFSDQVNP